MGGREGERVAEREPEVEREKKNEFYVMTVLNSLIIPINKLIALLLLFSFVEGISSVFSPSFPFPFVFFFILALDFRKKKIMNSNQIFLKLIL